MLSNSAVITPYSSITEVGDNVPALRSFFRCTETSGTYMRDSHSGVVYTPTDIAFTPSSFAVDPEDTTAIPISGTFPTFGTKTIVAMVAGTALTAATGNFRFAIGDTPGSAGSIGLSNWGKTHLAITDGTNAFGLSNFTNTGTTLAVGTEILFYAYFTPGVSCKVTLYNLTTGSVAVTETVSLAAVTMGSVTPASLMRANGINVYMAAAFAFNSLPADLDAAALWMALSAKQGKKYIYPAWVGRT